jgi:hypothetical protein
MTKSTNTLEPDRDGKPLAPRCDAVGRLLTRCIKDFLATLQVRDVGSQLVGLPQSPNVFLVHAGMLTEDG